MVVALIAFTARLAAAETNAEEVIDDASSITGDAEAASFDPTWSDAGAADAREAGVERDATDLGRVDLTITWRRTVRVAEMRGAHDDGADSDGAPSSSAIASAIDPVTTTRGVLWVLLTWSR